MSDFRDIAERYQKNVLTEGSYNNAREHDQQRKRQIPGLTPKTDLKNSTASRTAFLPTNGGGDFNAARMGSGAEIDNEEEMVEVKGYGKMSKQQLKTMIAKLLSDVQNLLAKSNYAAVTEKLEMANNLSKYL